MLFQIDIASCPAIQLKLCFDGCRWWIIGMWGVLTLFHSASDDISISPVLWIVMTINGVSTANFWWFFFDFWSKLAMTDGWNGCLLCICLDAQVGSSWKSLFTALRIFDRLMIVVWTVFPPSSPFCCQLWWLRFLNCVAEFIMLTAIEAVSECVVALNWFLSILLTQLLNPIIVPGWIVEMVRLLRSLTMWRWIRYVMVSVPWECILYVNQCQKGVQSALMAHYLTKHWEILLILHTFVMRLNYFILHEFTGISLQFIWFLACFHQSSWVLAVVGVHCAHREMMITRIEFLNLLCGILSLLPSIWCIDFFPVLQVVTLCCEWNVCN